MTNTLDTIKQDITDLTAKQFYLKHFHRSDNWYFENVLGIPSADIIHALDDFKSIISDNLKINFNCIVMVGSGKIGYSLTPTASKLYKEFNNDQKIRKISDIDVAVVSTQLFNKYWDLLRKSYKYKYIAHYQFIPTEIYRGYINEKHLLEIEGCRKEWIQQALASKKALSTNLFIQNEVTYRIYRNWEDFEDYHVQAIKKIKRGDIDGTII